MAVVTCEYCGQAVPRKPGSITLVPVGGGWWGCERIARNSDGALYIAEIGCERCVQRSLFLTLRKIADKLTLEPTALGTIVAQKCLALREEREIEPDTQVRAMLEYFLQNGWANVRPADVDAISLDTLDAYAIVGLILSEDGYSTPTGWIPNPDLPVPAGNPMSTPVLRSPMIYVHVRHIVEDVIEAWSVGNAIVLHGTPIELSDEERAVLRARHPTLHDRSTDA